MKKKTNGRRGFLALKKDISKAYKKSRMVHPEIHHGKKGL